MAIEWNHQTAEVNGINIHYVIHGHGSPVILLHGWPEMWYSWRKQIPVLAERFQVIAPDMRGFGYSDKPLYGYDTRTAASDIYQLARHLGHQRVSLVGHDIGVRVAYRYTLDHENEVERLALVDSPPPQQQLGSHNAESIRARWHSYFHQVPDLPERLVQGNEEAYLRHFYSDWSVNKHLFSAEEVAEYVRAYSLPGAWRSSFGYYRAAFREDVAQWQEDVGRKLNLPALVLYGDRRAGLSSSYGVDPLEAWQQHLSNARGREIKQGGHFLHEEQPEEVNKELLSFLSEGAG